MPNDVPLTKELKNVKFTEEFIKNDGNLSKTWQALNPDKEYKPDNASNIASRYLAANKKEIGKIFKELMITGKNSNLQAIANELSNQVLATKEVIYNSAGDIKEIKDNASRLDAIKTIAKIYGILSDKEAPEVHNFQVNVGTMNVDKLDLIMSKLKTLRSETPEDKTEIIDILPTKSN